MKTRPINPADVHTTFWAAPNFVSAPWGRLKHRPTGLFVDFQVARNRDYRAEAMARLTRLINERGRA